MSCICVKNNSDNIEEIDNIESELKDAPGGRMSSKTGLIEIDNKKLFVKGYNIEILNKIKINSYILKNLSIIIRKTTERLNNIICPITTNTKTPTECILEKGIALPLYVCSCSLRDGDYIIVAFQNLKGASLAEEYMKARTRQGIKYNQTTIKKLFCRLFNIVRAYWTAGLVHGDMNPGNIMIDGDNLYLLDTDGTMPFEYVRKYGLLFTVGDLDYEFLEHIREAATKKFKNKKNMLREYYICIDHFMFLYNTILLSLLIADEKTLKEADSHCCWRDLLHTRVPDHVSKTIHPEIIKYFKELVKNPENYLSQCQEKATELYNKLLPYCV